MLGLTRFVRCFGQTSDKLMNALQERGERGPLPFALRHPQHAVVSGREQRRRGGQLMLQLAAAALKTAPAATRTDRLAYGRRTAPLLYSLRSAR